MFGALMAAVSDQIAETRRSLIRLVVGGVIALAALVLLLSALLNALFIAVAMHHGPVAGYLAMAAAALVVAVVGLAIVLIRPRGARPLQPYGQPYGLTGAAPASPSNAFAQAAGAAAVDAAGSVAAQAFEAARGLGKGVGKSARDLGERIADDVKGQRKKPVSRAVLINASLAAAVVGMLIGRKI